MKVPRIFQICPGFSPRIFPEFFEDFSFFVSQETKTTKNHQKSPPFFNAKSPGKYENNTHNIFLERRQSQNLAGSFPRIPAECRLLLNRVPSVWEHCATWRGVAFALVTFCIFSFLSSCLNRGCRKGERGCLSRGGGRFVYENRKGGGEEVGWGRKGAMRVSDGRKGGKYFFLGPTFPPS